MSIFHQAVNLILAVLCIFLVLQIGNTTSKGLQYHRCLEAERKIRMKSGFPVTEVEKYCSKMTGYSADL